MYLHSLYIMTFNKYGMDQYDSFLVSADSKQECKEIVEKDHKDRWISDVNWNSGFKIEPIGATMKDKGILLDSYNAG